MTDEARLPWESEPQHAARAWTKNLQSGERLRWASWCLNPGETRLVVRRLDTDVVRFDFTGPMELCLDDARSLAYALEEHRWDEWDD